MPHFLCVHFHRSSSCRSLSKAAAFIGIICANTRWNPTSTRRVANIKFDRCSGIDVCPVQIPVGTQQAVADGQNRQFLHGPGRTPCLFSEDVAFQRARSVASTVVPISRDCCDFCVFTVVVYCTPLVPEILSALLCCCDPHKQRMRLVYAPRD